MSPVAKAAGALALAVAVLAAACGAPPSAGGATGAPTASAAPTVAASTPGATASSSPTPRPSPVVSTRGAILVKDPAAGEQLTSPAVVSGEASVFEATLRYRIVTAGGTVLAEGTTTATAGAPQTGTFRVEVPFTMPSYGEAGFVEVFERSPKDGSISDIARVPVGITGSY